MLREALPAHSAPVLTTVDSDQRACASCPSSAASALSRRETIRMTLCWSVWGRPDSLGYPNFNLVSIIGYILLGGLGAITGTQLMPYFSASEEYDLVEAGSRANPAGGILPGPCGPQSGWRTAASVVIWRQAVRLPASQPAGEPANAVNIASMPPIASR